MNHKLVFYIATILILHPFVSKAKKITVHNISLQNTPQKISPSYFFQVNLNHDDCKKLLEHECFFNDKILSEPYFHQTKLTIFLDKIFATQYYNNDQVKLLQVKDGNYSLKSSNENLISLNIKNGNINNLLLISGKIESEQNNISKCQKAENLYNFYNIYNKTDEIFTKSQLYKDEHHFSGLNEYILFAEKDNQAEIMAVEKATDSTIKAIHNINVCKMQNSDILNIRHTTSEECQKSNFSIDECYKYENCEEKIIVEDCEVTLFKDDLL